MIILFTKKHNLVSKLLVGNYLVGNIIFYLTKSLRNSIYPTIVSQNQIFNNSLSYRDTKYIHIILSTTIDSKIVLLCHMATLFGAENEFIYSR